MLRTRIKKITYANGFTEYYPQVRLFLFWRSFTGPIGLFSFKHFFRDTTCSYRSHNAYSVTELFLETTKVDLRTYYNSYLYNKDTRKVIKVEILNQNFQS